MHIIVYRLTVAIDKAQLAKAVNPARAITSKISISDHLWQTIDGESGRRRSLLGEQETTDANINIIVIIQYQ